MDAIDRWRGKSVATTYTIIALLPFRLDAVQLGKGCRCAGGAQQGDAVRRGVLVAVAWRSGVARAVANMVAPIMRVYVDRSASIYCTWTGTGGRLCVAEDDGCSALRSCGGVLIMSRKLSSVAGSFEM